jgi:hypothetical protein
MKAIFTILFFSIVSFETYSQTTEKGESELRPNAVSYRLFPTQNIWTFIKLNTRNGKMWQVQFDIQGDNRGTTFLNILPLVSSEEEVNDRFTLYPTQNMYNFILLDQLNGRTWQVQWSTKFENRLIVPIESDSPMLEELVDKLIKGDTTERKKN